MVLPSEQMKCVSWCELKSVRCFVEIIFAHEQGLSTQGKTSPFCFIIALHTRRRLRRKPRSTSYTPVLKKLISLELTHCSFFQAARKMTNDYTKPPTIFQNKKHVLQGKTGKEKLPWYYKKTLVQASRHPRRPLRPPTSVRTAPSMGPLHLMLDPVWCHDQVDAKDHCHLPGLSPLHPKVQSL